VKIEGTYNFAASREKVFEVLQDPEVLSRIIPGCEELKAVAENEYEAALLIAVGPVKGKFQGKVIISDLNPPESYTMQVSGNGAPGFVKGTGHVKLSDGENNDTHITYEGDAQVGGKIASVGQRLVESTAKAMIKQSLEGVNQYINSVIEAENKPAEPETAPATTAEEDDAPEEIKATKASTASASLKPLPVQPQAPSQIEFAKGVAKHLMDDLVPREKRPIFIGGVLVALLLLLVLTRRKKK
jgi:carbon monoxide dehydrogenase subunit G